MPAQNLNRLKQLAGITEADEVLDQDEFESEEDRKRDIHYTRQQEIARLILKALLKMGLPVMEGHSMASDEDMYGYDFYFDLDERESSFALDECMLSKLSILKDSGLADDYKVSVSAGNLTVSFKVSDNIIDGNATFSGR